ncbi:Glycerophosphocholine phosphodiesterase GPCPD1 [Halotydeus destructor]|nr:Glycerophosphocholine phosphodiesterase GPCPD1 [Halotydeus destructor]
MWLLLDQGYLGHGVIVQLKVYGRAISGFAHYYNRITAKKTVGDAILEKDFSVAMLREGACDFHDQSTIGQNMVSERFTTYNIHLDQSATDTHFEMKFLDLTGSEIARAIFIPDLEKFSSTMGDEKCPILMTDGSPEGNVLLQYLIIKPFTNLLKNPINNNEAKQWKGLTSERQLHVGHRGLGNGRKGAQRLLENTIASFNAAAQAGADMIELDVCLTQDGQVIVYHDLELVHFDTNLVIPIKDLTYEQLTTKHLIPVNRDLLSDEKRKLKFYQDEPDPTNRPFPKLSQVLLDVDPDCAINVEIKFPHQIEDDTWIPHPPLEINYYVDTILEQIFSFAGERHILITCFDPDVCMTCRAKQTRYPVAFLTRGTRQLTPKLKDIRMSEVATALYFAKSANLAGINAYARDLLTEKTANILDTAKRLKLLVFCWDSQLTVDEVIWLCKFGTNGIMYDDIDKKLPTIKSDSGSSQDSLDSNNNMTLK